MKANKEKKVNDVYKIMGKTFIYDGEEWVVEELLLYGNRCKCRSYFSEDRTKQFYCDYVKEQITNYENNLIIRSKVHKENHMDFEKMWYELKQCLIQMKETDILMIMDENEIAEVYKEKGIESR